MIKLTNKETGEVMMETSENWVDIYLSREFEPSEVRLLIDGLLFSHHIPRDNCQELAEKLSRIVSPYFKSHVRHIYTMPESIPQNPQIFLNIELLDEAIHLGRQVEFSYLEYGTDKKQHPRTYKNGRVRRYRVSPYQSGRMIPNTASMPYLTQLSARVTRLFRSLGPGALYSSSWIQPKGHSQPQIIRPSSRPKSAISPTA